MTRPTISLATVLILSISALTSAGEDASFRVTRTQNTEVLTPFDVFEITLEHPNHYANPFHGRDRRRYIPIALRQACAHRRLSLRLAAAADDQVAARDRQGPPGVRVRGPVDLEGSLRAVRNRDLEVLVHVHQSGRPPGGRQRRVSRG